MEGRIIKGIGGFYYVHARDGAVYECRAKGIFRNRNEKPLVGDIVNIETAEDAGKTGNITDIFPRKNRLVRPAAANIDLALVVFAAAKPNPSLYLLDSFLVCMRHAEIPAAICFNKTDLSSEDEISRYRSIYENSGAGFVSVCAKTGSGFDSLKDMLKGKLTVLAGPSGVGKSSIMNRIYPAANAVTGDISRKLGRGKNTTRHSEIFSIGGDGYLMDTPGFSSLELPDVGEGKLKDYFPEFAEYGERCRFQGCLHRKEPDCVVIKAVVEEKIPKSRYDSYINMLDAIEIRKKRQGY